ncbi:MAG: DNA gyrase inhibitor YacG [Alphaproteobacteria bacterium]|nr:DNA gyrase inhibitor YacG [Alphaproteobacteria bacterium]
MDGDKARRYHPGAPCPICGKPAAEGKFQPFCSGRCAQIDLGRWLGEKYRVPTDELPTDGASQEADLDKDS